MLQTSPPISMTVSQSEVQFRGIQAGIYQLKVNNGNTRTRCGICSKLTIKTPQQRYCTVVFFSKKGYYFYRVYFAMPEEKLLYLEITLNLNIYLKPSYSSLFSTDDVSVTISVSLNPLQFNGPFLYPLKTSENHNFSDAFNEYRNGILG